MSHYTCIVPKPRMHRFRSEAPTPQPTMTEAEIGAAMLRLAMAEGKAAAMPASREEVDPASKAKGISPAMRSVVNAMRGKGQLDRHTIARAAGVSVNSITDAVRKLNQAGYHIQSTMHLAGRVRLARYELLSEPETQAADELPKRLAHHVTLEALRLGPATAAELKARRGQNGNNIATHIAKLRDEGHKITGRRVDPKTGGFSIVYTLEEEA